MKKKVLITGANGQLGTFVQQEALNYSNIELIPVTREQLDLSDHASIESTLLALRPDVVLNAAAYTAVDKAEEERELSMSINATAVGEIAKTCEKMGAALVQISTDYVFDGTKQDGYLTTDEPNPINYYGVTKLEGERLAKRYCSQVTIIRTSWVHSNVGKNFETTMKRLFQEKEELQVVNDQRGKPTHAKDLAKKALDVCSQKISGELIVHFSGEFIMTWYDFANSLLRNENNSKTNNIVPVTSENYPTVAKRPKFSVLKNG